MSLWGPAAEAEIEYRQDQVRKAWGGRRTSGADGFDRLRRRAERRAEQAERTAERVSERRARPDRAEQIREGIAGMRPAATTGHGLFA